MSGGRPTKLLTLGLPAWFLEAECANYDPDLFFPEVGQTSRKAKKICNACPIKSKCLEWTMATNQTFGVWGGTSEHDRRRLRREARGA